MTLRAHHGYNPRVEFRPKAVIEIPGKNVETDEDVTIQRFAYLSASGRFAILERDDCCWDCVHRKVGYIEPDPGEYIHQHWSPCRGQGFEIASGSSVTHVLTGMKIPVVGQILKDAEGETLKHEAKPGYAFSPESRLLAFEFMDELEATSALDWSSADGASYGSEYAAECKALLAMLHERCRDRVLASFADALAYLDRTEEADG